VSGADEIVYGQHAVRALLERGGEGLREGWVQRGRDTAASRRLRAAAAAGRLVLHELSRAELDALLPGARHQGVAVLRRAGVARRGGLEALLAGLAADPLVLVLDRVEDPRNLGACLRTAEAAGCAGVVVPRRRASGLTPAARKVACGAAERVLLAEVGNLAVALERLREAGFALVGAEAGSGEPIYRARLTGPLALVLGGESRGLRRLTRERCERLVHVPMAAPAESLNVSVAAALCLFEARRQRLASIDSGEAGR